MLLVVSIILHLLTFVDAYIRARVLAAAATTVASAARAVACLSLSLRRTFRRQRDGSEKVASDKNHL